MAKARTAAARAGLAAVLAVFLLRVFAGAFFLETTVYKLWIHPRAAYPDQPWLLSRSVDDFVALDYRPQIEAAIAEPPRLLGLPLTGYAVFLEEVMLPNAAFFGPLILVAEALLGVSLVLGVAVRLSASLGFAMMVCFGLAKRTYLLTLTSGHWPITLILLACALLAAGRSWGLDARLRPRLPRALAWIS